MDSVLAAHIPRPSDPQRPTFRLAIECAFPTPNLRVGTEENICRQIKGLARVARFRGDACARLLEKITFDVLQMCRMTPKQRYRCGATVMSRRAWIRFSSGGWVLNREDRPPPPNMGFTMHNAEVDGESEVVGIRWL